MSTNRHKYDYYYNLVQNRNEEFIKRAFMGEHPDRFYKAIPGQIQEYKITKISYENKTNDGKWIRAETYDRIPNERVKRIIDYYEHEQIYDRCNILVHYSYAAGFGIISGAEKLTDICIGRRMSFVRDELLELANELDEKYGEREGYIHCHYCGKNVDVDKVYNAIIYKYNKNGTYTKEDGKYCNTQCHLYHTYSMEG